MNDGGLDRVQQQTRRCRACRLKLPTNFYAGRDTLCVACRKEWSKHQNEKRKARSPIDDLADFRRAAETVAARLTSSGSKLEWEELVQVAYTAMLECRTTYKPEYGVPFMGYAWKAGLYAAQRANAQSLRDKVRLAKEAVRYGELEEPVAEDASVVFDRIQWREAVRDEVRRILQGKPPSGALPLVLREKTAEQLAGEQRCSTSKIYNDSWELRKLLRQSPELQRLWRER